MSKQCFGIIYKALFENGKCYVGQTQKTLENRINMHQHDSVKAKCAFHNAILKYGIENIVWNIVDTANSIEELNDKEIYWITLYNSFASNGQGYNLTFGGGGKLGWIASTEQKEAQMLRLIGNKNASGKRTEKQRAKMSLAQTGISKPSLLGNKNGTGKRTKQQCARIALGKIGEKNSRAKLTDTQRREIYVWYSLGGITQTKLANLYNVTQSTIGRIINNETWKEQNGQICKLS